MNLKLLLCLVLVSTACSADSANKSSGSVDDFDRFCQAFNELATQPDYKTMSSEERHIALMDLLSAEVQPESHAYIAWDAVRFADPHERYNLFTDAATASTQKEWQCEPMKMYAHEVGRP